MYMALLFPIAMFWWEGEKFTPMAFLVLYVGLILAGELQNVLGLVRAVHETLDPNFYEAVQAHNADVLERRRQRFQDSGLPAAHTLAQVMVWWEAERPYFLRSLLLIGLGLAVLAVLKALR